MGDCICPIICYFVLIVGITNVRFSLTELLLFRVIGVNISLLGGGPFVKGLLS
jgi:hypothetical protein